MTKPINIGAALIILIGVLIGCAAFEAGIVIASFAAGIFCGVLGMGCVERGRSVDAKRRIRGRESLRGFDWMEVSVPSGDRGANRQTVQ